MTLRTFGAFVASILVAQSAYADDVPREALAEKLFRAGRTMLAEGKLREACENFSESKQLDPTPGTLLNLGSCLEDLGRTASAWAVYRELEARATKRGQTARAQFASEKAAELEPQVPTLEIRIAPEHRVQGLVVECDGIVLGSAALSTRVPVDPGHHRITAHASGRNAWAASVDAFASRTTPVDIPLLVPIPAESSEPPRSAELAAANRSESSPLRPIGIGLTLVGGVATVTGLAFGGAAMVMDDSARRDTCIPAGCTREGVDRIRRADDLATVSTVVTISGLALSAVGAAVWLLAPARTGGGPRAAAGVGTLLFGGTFQ